MNPDKSNFKRVKKYLPPLCRPLRRGQCSNEIYRSLAAESCWDSETSSAAAPHWVTLAHIGERAF